METFLSDARNGQLSCSYRDDLAKNVGHRMPYCM